jgi:hypothetical protein
MTRQNQENSGSDNIRLLLEAAKVEEPEAENSLAEAVEPVEAEELDEEDKSSQASPSTLFKPAAARPKLVLANRLPGQ